VQDVIDELGITTLSKAHDYITIDGQVHGLDVVTVVFGLLYNQALFDEGRHHRDADDGRRVARRQPRLTHRPEQFGMHSSHVIAEPEATGSSSRNGLCHTMASGPRARRRWSRRSRSSMRETLQDDVRRLLPQGSNDATATRQWADQQIAQQLIVSALVNVYKTTAPELYPNIRSYSLPWPEQEVDRPYSPDHGQRQWTAGRRLQGVREIPVHA
jgi:hypothetical protein